MAFSTRPVHVTYVGACPGAVHPEVDEPDIVRWVEEDAEYVEGALGPGGAARILADTKRYMPRFREHGDRMREELRCEK